MKASDGTKVTRAAARALSFVHLTGSFPAGIHGSTFSTLFRACNGRVRGPITLPYVEIAENHRMTRAVRMLESKGFGVTRHYYGCSSRYVTLRNNKTGVVAAAYSDGYWSIDYSRNGQSGRI